MTNRFTSRSDQRTWHLLCSAWECGSWGSIWSFLCSTVLLIVLHFNNERLWFLSHSLLWKGAEKPAILHDLALCREQFIWKRRIKTDTPLDKRTLYFSSRPSSTKVRRKSFSFDRFCAVKQWNNTECYTTEHSTWTVSKNFAEMMTS